jgi:DNA-binding winged helix-turn-helix (wHTH) protein
MLQQGLTKFVEGAPVSAPPPQVGAQPVVLTGMIRFRDFEVWPGDRLLLRRRQPVCIGSRAFDLLVVLLRSRGEIVSKEAIFEYVWPSTTVEESNLRFQVASLRKALGVDRELIKSIPGRGYLFAADQDAEQEFEACSTASGRMLLHNVLRHAGSGPAMIEPRGAVGTGATGDEALEMLLRSAGKLVAAYGSIDAILGALDERRG